jgi:hypothetical protein
MKNKLFFQIDLGVFPSIVFVAIGYKSIREVMNKIGVTEDWNISDDALMRADSVDDARIIDAKNKEQFDVNDTQQSFNMPGADRFADDEFDDVDDDVDE